MRLKGKIAVVTGGGSGIGLATVERFVQEGATVLCLDIRLSPELERLTEKEKNIVYKRADVSKEEDIREALDYCAKTFGRIDILFNNVGVAIQGAIGELSQKDWDAVFSVNVRGAFLGTKYVLPYMLKQGSGSIINTASSYGLIAQPRLAVYCATKSAIIGMTRQTALDYARFGIRCNCVCPGLIRTPAIEGHYGPQESLSDKGKYIVSGIPLGRIGEPREIAAAVLFLASDEASFVTGSALVADGGQTIHTGPVWKGFDSPFQE